ncbi:MAG: hypothetical protein H0X36_01980 [Sphingomonadaceae bacterium]|nr:hypothetical protein [Sphingomonadaceae bacterium]
MRSASSQFAPDGRRFQVTSRAVAIALALAIEALLLIAMLRLGYTSGRLPDVARKLITFNLLPSSRVAPKPKPEGRSASKIKRESGGAPSHAAAQRTAPMPLPTANKVVALSKEEFAAADIGALPSHASGTRTGKDSGAAYGPGEGPGGAPLYNAEWYVEPTNGELALYLPEGGPKPGWALIICRTIENYHVENCRGLSESPPGSGLARAMRLASWQFRVRPPRIGGRPLIGAWVRIRFDFMVTAAKRPYRPAELPEASDDQ